MSTDPRRLDPANLGDAMSLTVAPEEQLHAEGVLTGDAARQLPTIWLLLSPHRRGRRARGAGARRAAAVARTSMPPMW